MNLTDLGTIIAIITSVSSLYIALRKPKIINLIFIGTNENPKQPNGDREGKRISLYVKNLTTNELIVQAITLY